MPEGDTLYKIASFMQPRMQGACVETAEVARRPMAELSLRQVTDVTVRGKHLLIWLAGKDDLGWVLRVHLGMTGSWHVYHREERWQRPAYTASVVLRLSTDLVFVCFSAEDAELLRPLETGRSRSPVARLGPDLLAPTCDFNIIVSRVRCRPKTLPMVDILLNQQVACGLGNVYKNELLYLYGLHPLTESQAVDDASLQSIFARGRTLLQQNLGGWPRTTTYDRSVCGFLPGRPRLHVYGRRESGCLVCEGPISKAITGRTRRITYWCPVCQSATDSRAAKPPHIVWDLARPLRDKIPSPCA